MYRAASTTRLRSLTQRSLAYIKDEDMYSDMAGHVGASLRRLTQSIHMYFVMEKIRCKLYPDPWVTSQNVLRPGLARSGDLSNCTLTSQAVDRPGRAGSNNYLLLVHYKSNKTVSVCYFRFETTSFVNIVLHLSRIIP